MSIFNEKMLNIYNWVISLLPLLQKCMDGVKDTVNCSSVNNNNCIPKINTFTIFKSKKKNNTTIL